MMCLGKLVAIRILDEQRGSVRLLALRHRFDHELELLVFFPAYAKRTCQGHEIAIPAAASISRGTRGPSSGSRWPEKRDVCPRRVPRAGENCGFRPAAGCSLLPPWSPHPRWPKSEPYNEGPMHAVFMLHRPDPTGSELGLQ